MRRGLIWFLVLLLTTAAVLALYWPTFAGTRGTAGIEAPRQVLFLHPDPTPLQAFYDAVVKEGGRVDYVTALGPPRSLLNDYLDQAARATPAAFESDTHRLAYYINTYNALVIQGVLRHWPIDSVEDVGPLHRFFRMRDYTVAGTRVSLHGFETRVIRRYDARLHFTLNCASASCPPLWREVYRVADLDDQLEAATHRFISDTAFNRYDAATDTWHISMIFKWYAEDFGGDQGVRHLLEKHTGISSKSATLSYQPYDWSLNRVK